VQPVIGQQCTQQSRLTAGQQHHAIKIALVHLNHHFATTTARWQDAGCRDCNDPADERLARQQHGGDGGMLSAKADATAKIKTDARVKLTAAGF